MKRITSFAITFLFLATIFNGFNFISIVSAPSEPFNNTQNLGWELLDNNSVLHMWNSYNSYYFSTENGIQFSNHYDEYWSRNVLMLGYYASGNWNLIYRTDALSGFNKILDTDNTTYINATIWKDLQYILGGNTYNFRLAIRYCLRVNDSDLTVIPYIKNLGIAIPFDIGFGWEIKDIKISNTYENDWVRLYNGTTWASYLLNQTLDSKFTNMGNNTIFYLEGRNEGKYLKRTLYLSWNSTLNYLVWVKSRTGQYNAPVSLFIKVGPLALNQEKYTMMHWLDSDEWLGISSSEYDSHCGDTLSHTLVEALDGTDYWAHSVSEVHWLILDLGDNYLIKKVRSRSMTSADPTDVNVYVSMNTTDWGTAVALHVARWQDTVTWVEEDTTDKIGQYIKIEVIATEDGSDPGHFIQWGDALSPCTIFDVFGDLASVTYYFNSYDPGERWDTFPEYMVDGDWGTSASTTIDKDVEFLNENTYTMMPPVDLGEIVAVEIRACGFYRLGDNPADIILRPVFVAGDGDNHVYDCPAGSFPGSWSEWFDITTDTNAPTWDTWADIGTLKCDVESVIPGKSILYCSYVGIRVTYTPPAETVILHPDAEGTTQQWLPYPSGTHWTKVDDPSGSPDEDTTYVYTNVQNKKEEFNHETSDLFTGADITNITLTARAKAVYSNDVVYTSQSDGYIYNSSASYTLTRGATTGTVLVDTATSRVGQQGTPIWQNQTSANSNQKLYSGSVVRAGQYVTTPFPAVTVTRIDLMLNKSGSPTGTASVTIRSAIGDTLLGTIGTINVATLTTTPTWYSFTTTPVTVTPAQNARFLIEYSGGSSTAYICARYQSTNVILFGARTTYVPSTYTGYLNDCTFRIKYYQYQVDRLYYFFDTSTLPDDATITAVTLNLYCTSDNSVTDFKVTVQSGMPTYPHDPLVGGDFNMANYAGDGGTLTTVGISVLGWNVLTLNSTGRGWISKTSWTKFCLRSSRDIGNNNPTGDEYINLATRSTLIPSNYPYLSITFTVPTPATLNLGVNIGGTRYGAPSNNTLSTSYADKTYTWAVNPADSGAWESSDITNLQSSLLSSLVPCSNISIRCTQVYLTIEYSFPVVLEFDINISSFGFGTVLVNTVVYSNQTSTQYTMTIYNNGTCAIDIDVNGTNAIASGVPTWVLSATNGDNKYVMEIYNQTTNWWKLGLVKDTWYSNMADATSIQARLRITTPTTFYSGKQMSCHIYMVASIH